MLEAKRAKMTTLPKCPTCGESNWERREDFDNVSFLYFFDGHIWRERKVLSEFGEVLGDIEGEGGSETSFYCYRCEKVLEIATDRDERTWDRMYEIEVDR